MLYKKVSNASVETEGNCISSINKGFLVLVGIGKEDTQRKPADQLCKENDKSAYLCRWGGQDKPFLADVNGEILLVSQFTLYANCKKGNRPSFFDAGNPQRGRGSV